MYEEIVNLDDAKRAIMDYLGTYPSQKHKMDLVIFNYVIEHISRVVRVLKQPFGNCLLIGVGGSGIRMHMHWNRNE